MKLAFVVIYYCHFKSNQRFVYALAIDERFRWFWRSGFSLRFLALVFVLCQVS